MRETQVGFLGWEDLPGEGNGNPLWYSCLENPMDGGAWQATVHGVANSQTRLSDYSLCVYVYQLEYQNHQLVVCEWGFIQETGQPARWKEP